MATLLENELYKKIFVFGLLFSWLVLTIIIGKWSEKKGGSFWGGVLMSIFFSPLMAAIILVVRDPKTEEINKNELASGKKKKCPHCSGVIPVDEFKCHYCGGVV